MIGRSEIDEGRKRKKQEANLAASSFWSLQWIVRALVALLLFGLSVPAFADNGNQNPVVFGPQTFVRCKGAPTTYTANFNVPSWVVGPFTMQVVNGDSSGRERVSSATVALNGTQVVSPSQLNQNVASLSPAVSPITGNNTLQVTVEGNVGGELTITIVGTNNDHASPAVTIVTPASGSYINTATPRIQITYKKPQGGSQCDQTTLQVTIDGINRTNLFTIRDGDATATIPQNLALSAGSHTIVATIYDHAQNQGSAASTFTVDLAVPTIQIVQPALGAYLNTTTPTITIQYSDNDAINTSTLKVTVNGTDLTSLFTKTTTGATATLTAANALPQGATQVVAQIQDMAGNQASASTSFNIDTTPPAISISHPAANSYDGSSSETITVQYSDDQAINTATLSITLDGAALKATTSSGTASATATGLTNGSHKIAATITDMAGNPATTQIVFYVDDTIPAIHVTQPASGALLNLPNPTVTISYSDAVGINAGTLQVFVNGVNATSLFSVGPTSATAQLSGAFVLPDGQNTITAQVANLGGNTGSTSDTFTIDTTPPTIVFQAPPAETNSNTPTITIVYSDATSGVNAYSLKVTLDGADVSTLVAPGASSASGVLQLNPPLADGTHHLSATVADNAGNVSQPATLTFIVDTKPPVLALVSPANDSFINNPTPSLLLQYNDGTGVGVNTSSIDVQLTQGANPPVDITGYFQIGPLQATGAIPAATSLSDGTYVLNAVASDLVGNLGSASATFVVDTVPPTATVQAPAANAILNTPAVNVILTYSDDRSGVNTSNILFTVDGVSQIAALTVSPTQATGTLPSLPDGTHTIQLVVYDRAGSPSASISQTFTIDTVGPTIATSVAPAPNAKGWNNTNVTVTFMCASTEAGVAICPAPVAAATEGPNQQFCGQAVDAAGNVSAPACATVNIDKTPPTITYSLSPMPNAGGIITSTPVTIAFSCSDSLSGVATCSSPITVTTTGLNQSFTGTATDVAGNSATATVTVSIQTVAPTPPSIVASVSPSPNSKGWNNTNVTVSYACTPGSNPVASCPSPVVVSTQGAGQSICGKALDTAGLSANACATVSLDETPPTITASPSPAANGAGWNNTPVTVTFACTDSVSGVATYASPQTVSTDGAGQVVSGTCVDVAGNSASTHVTLNVEQTPPSVLSFTAPSQLAPGQSGTATVTASSLSGITAVVFQLNGSTLSTLNSPPYSITFSAPTTATAGSTLTLTVSAADAAGNANSSARGIQVVLAGVVTGQVLADATGLPLAGAIVQIEGGSGQDTSDNNGRYSIPSNTTHLFLSISMPANATTGTSAMVTVERDVPLQSGVGTVPIDARMTPVTQGIPVNSTGGSLALGTVTIGVAVGAVSSPTNLHLSSLSQQALPGLLPLGWSPLVAFDLQSDNPTSASFTGTFAQLPQSTTMHLAQYSYTSHAWQMVTPNLTAPNGSLSIPIPSIGDFALVIPDAGSTAPSVPSAGQPLPGVSMVTLPTGSTASGSLNPPSISPTGGTSTATLGVQSSVPLPSGTVIQANVLESYSLASGQQLSDALRTEDILLYQYAAPAGSAAVASFPVTPSQTFQPELLSSGDVHLDILSGRESIRGSVGGSDAVTATGGNATLTIAAGSLPQDTAIAVAPEATDTFLPSTASLIPLAEYHLDFSGQVLNAAAQLSVAVGNAQAGESLFLAQIQRINGVPYLVVVSLAQINGANLVTQAVPGLSGIMQGGDYIFYAITSPVGFVSGTVTASSGPVAALIQTDALPFVAFSNFSGSYVIPALAGTVNLTGSVPNTALAGTNSVQVTAGQTATANITVLGQTESATITPPNGAVGVPLTAEIDITAPDAFNQSTVTTTSVTLTQNGQGAGVSVPIFFVFSEGGARLSVFPQSALQPSTTYTLAASGIANVLGGLISIPTVTFTTLANTPPSFNTSALVFAMPDQNGNSTVSAPPNSFPSGTTILIVDQTNGVVLSLTVANDGSVTGRMPATIDDVLAVTITAPDKTTASFTLSQFVAPDGTTAIGSGGGTVIGPGGTGMIIPAGALNKGTTFKLALLDQTAFPQLPNWGGNINFGSGMQISAPAMPSFNKEVKLAFPVPANAPSGAFYYVFRRLTDSNGDILWETIDEAFVQGTGTNAQVVTASPPFCGYTSSYGSFQAAAGAGYQPLQAAVVVTFMLWDYDPNQPGTASPGLLVGNVFQNDASGNPGPLANGVQAVIALGSPTSSTGGTGPQTFTQNVTTMNGACQTYSLFDPEFGGGARTVTATATLPTYNAATGQTTTQKQVITETADEVNGVQPDDALFSVTAGLEAQYRNIGRLNFTFAPATPPPPTPEIVVGIYTVDNSGNRQSVTGIVQTGTPLLMNFGSSSGLTLISATVNGGSFSSLVPDASPSSPIAGYTYMRFNDALTPTATGVYNIVATAENALNPGVPVTVTRSFLVVAAGGGNTYASADTAPAVISTIPAAPNNTNVSTLTFPQVVFSEPVVNVPGSVTLVGSAGDSPTLLLIGVKPDGTLANPVKATDPITSLTIEPVTGLQFGETYTLTLTNQIVNYGADQNGNSIGQLPLNPAPYTMTFATFGPQQLGGSSSAYPVLTRPVVLGQLAYTGEFVNSVTGGLGIFDMTNPAIPVDKGVGASFIGRPTDIAGLLQSPVTGGALVAISASTAQDVAIPGNVWLYSVPSLAQQLGSSPPTRVGAVSVTSSADQAGVPIRLAMKDQYLYASTTQQGLQVVDLGQAITEYQQASPSDFGTAVSTDGEGFATDAVINTIQLPLPCSTSQPSPCGGSATMFGLSPDYFTTSTSGTTGATATLLAATGNLPLVIVDPTLNASQAILWPPMSQSGSLSQAPLQGAITNPNGTPTIGTLNLGRAVALTTIPVTNSMGVTSNQHLVVVLGSGTIGSGTVPVLAVVDLSGAYNQGATVTCPANATSGSPNCPLLIGMVQLPTTGTDLAVNGSVAFVATGTSIIVVNLENPTQPALAGTINGTLGDWLTITNTGFLISTSSASSTNSIQSADLDSTRKPGDLADTGHCIICEGEVSLPINVATGNVYIDQTDYSIPGIGGGIQVSRVWNSRWNSNNPPELSGTFGNSWRSSYDERLVFPAGANGTQQVQYWLVDGSEWFFQSPNTPPGPTYTVSAPANEHATLTVNQLKNTSYTITFKDGNQKVFNQSGYLIAIIDRNGNQTTVNYDASNRITNVTDAVGRVLQFNYGPGREATSIQDAVGTVANYTYDAAERLTQVAFPDGSQLNMTYDTNDMMLTVTDALGKVIETHTYDSNSRGLTSAKANGVQQVTLQYTADGQTQLVDSQSKVSNYASAKFGQRSYVTSITGPGCASCGGRNNNTYDYLGTGDRSSSTDAADSTTTYTYDNNSNLISSSTPFGNSVITWNYTYNSFSEVLTAIDPMGNPTTNTYDAKGDLLTTTSPAPGNGMPASVTTFGYNNLGELISITDSLKNTTLITYTPAGLIQTVTDAQHNTTTYAYDVRGNRLSVSDPAGNTSYFGYDLMNRLVTIKYADSSTIQFTYDIRGRRASVVDQNGKATYYVYDDADRVTSVRDASGNSTFYAYDTESNLINITDPNNHTNGFSYNSLGWLTQTTFPSGLSETYTYDPVGNLQTKTDRKGQTLSYGHDQLYRLVSKTYPDGTGESYTYDNDSRLTKVVDSTGTYQFTFDNVGRLIATNTQYSFLPSRTFTNSYSYDAASNRVGFTDPEGGSTTYGYDVLNRLQTLTPPSAFTAGAAGASFGFNYDPLGRRTSLTRPNGVNTSYSYDNLSRLLSVLHQSGGNTIDGASYKLDAAGNRTAKTDQYAQVTTNYNYDQLYQLLSATRGGTTVESYTYDAVGNRLSALNSSGWTYDASNELTSTPNGSYTYDANGNTLTDAAGRIYTWDFEDRLTQVVVPGIGTVSFKYDPLGRRIYKSSSSGTSIYAYDSDNLIEETDASGAPVGRYTQLAVDEPIAMFRVAGAAAFYQVDGIGAVTSLSSTTGSLSQTYAYDSFGVTTSTGSIFNPFQYTGREFDPETGLYFYRARYYDPSSGRFISGDPLRYGGGSNFYAYAGNNPTDLVDSYGLAPGDWWDPRSYSYSSMLTKQNAWATLKDVGNAAEAFTDAITFGSASRLNNALGANVAVDRCGIGHKLASASGLIASVPLGGEALPAGLKWLPNKPKQFIGEGLSIAKNALKGNRLIGTQIRAADAGFRGVLTTTFDSVWESSSGARYYVESKFGMSTLTDPQKLARATLGASYHVERWGYPFFGRVGRFLGPLAGAGSKCDCK
jgi:RHS repeat-associated protein